MKINHLLYLKLLKNFREIKMKNTRYTVDLKPIQKDVEQTFGDFPDLKRLLKSSGSKLCIEGFYSINNGKIYETLPAEYDFFKYQLPHPTNPKITLSSISIRCVKENKQKRNQGKIIDKFWNNHSNKHCKPYGFESISSTYRESFNRSHLIADSIIDYCGPFNYFKWQNFVMLTEWCNRANTANEANGMFFFENMILQTLSLNDEKNIEIDYRVTPVFKPSLTNKSGFEMLPRGIILEAKITNGEIFTVDNDFYGKSEFNVFIPNAQKNLKIDYDSGKVNGEPH